MEASLSSSDVAMLSVITSMRDMQLDLCESLAMGTFIADNILANNCCRQHKDLNSFVEGFKLLILPASYSLFFNAIRQFNFEIFDSVKSLFNQNQQFSPNGAAVPYMIKRDSLVGMYVRVLCTKWNSLSFSSIGEVCENFSKFCSNNESPICSDLNLPYFGSMDVKVSSESYIMAAEKAMQNNDTYSALNNIHLFFDNLDAESMKAMTFTAASSPNQVIRQQRAMLSLATMWIKNEQFSQAIIATEEGMRMSHQLGDHTSVARALLLLHHVVDKLPKKDDDRSTAGSPSAESVLIRCIQRCTELNLRALEAQAILLLVRLRIKGPLLNFVPKLQLSGGIASIEEEYFQYRARSAKYNKLLNYPRHSRLSPSALWALLSSALLVESFYSSAVNVCDTTSHQYNTKRTFGPQKDDCYGGILDMMELIGYAGLVSGELWTRLGIFALTELSCKRTLRQAGIFMSAELVGYLCVSLSAARSKSQANGSMITLSHILLFRIAEDVSETLKNEALQRCIQAERLLLLASKRILFSYEAPLSISRMVEASLCLLKVRKKLYSCDLNSELGLKEILQMSHISALMQSESSRNYFLYYEAAILRCFISSFISIELMIQSLASFDDDITCDCVLKGEIKILKAIAKLFLKHKNISDGLSDIYDACTYSINEYTPVCDASLSVLTYINSK